VLTTKVALEERFTWERSLLGSKVIKHLIMTMTDRKISRKYYSTAREHCLNNFNFALSEVFYFLLLSTGISCNTFYI